jgi:hypothetical protein
VYQNQSFAMTKKTSFNFLMNILKEMTVYKIMENSIPVICKDVNYLFYSQYNFLLYKRNCIHSDIKSDISNQTNLGRWQLYHCEKNHELNSYYANTDHCGDYICGSPSILRKRYPKYHGLINIKLD